MLGQFSFSQMLDENDFIPVVAAATCMKVEVEVLDLKTKAEVSCTLCTLG